jgi:hypothetical protein
VLAPHAVQAVIKSLQGIPFCVVSTDASNHGAVKIFPILIHYFDYEYGGLQIKLLEVESKPNATAQTIAAYVSETASNYGLLSKCVAFAGDNCNTMFGGLKKRRWQKCACKSEEYDKAISDRYRVPCTCLK